MIKIIREMIENRRASLKTHDDMLSSILSNEDPRYALNDGERDDQIIMILNSGYETISTTTMMAIKYLHDHPQALQELRVKQTFLSSNKAYCSSPDKYFFSFLAKFQHISSSIICFSQNEHFMIRQEKSEGQPIDWNDYRTMRFTRAVS